MMSDAQWCQPYAKMTHHANIHLTLFPSQVTCAAGMYCKSNDKDPDLHHLPNIVMTPRILADLLTIQNWGTSTVCITEQASIQVIFSWSLAVVFYTTWKELLKKNQD